MELIETLVNLCNVSALNANATSRPLDALSLGIVWSQNIRRLIQDPPRHHAPRFLDQVPRSTGKGVHDGTLVINFVFTWSTLPR